MIGLLGRLWRQLSARRRRQFFFVLVMILAGAVAEVATLGAVLPFLAVIADPARLTRYAGVRDAIHALGMTTPADILLAATLLFSSAALVAGVVRVALTWATNKFVFRVGHDIGVKVYEQVLYQPYSYHVRQNTSNIIAAIEKVQLLVGLMLLPLMQAAGAVLIALFIVAALIVVDPLISTAAFASFGLLYVGVAALTRSRLSASSKIISLNQATRTQAVQEGLGGIRDVLLDSSQRIFVSRFRKLDEALKDAQATSSFISNSPRFVVEAAGMVMIAGLAFLLSGREGGIAGALPVLGALALGAQRLLPLMQIVYNGWARIAASANLLDDVLGLLEMPLPASVKSVTGPSLRFSREIAFRNVSFAYGPDRPPVIERLDFLIPKGARIGIVGRTGSGKSTLADLLMGLLEPTEGHIEVDGRRLDAATRRAWQHQIAHVPQAIFLADASIAENIAFGVEPGRIDQERVRACARQAELASFIESLPEGYGTRVGERGVRLSGGQRQRVGIARALYKDAQLLVFDEATSALDTETEAAVMDAIERLGRQLTIVIIAHRVSTVAGCSQVLRLDHGRIVQVSGYDKLMQNQAGIAPRRTGTDVSA